MAYEPLNAHVTPVNYRLAITPDLDPAAQDPRFRGHERITLRFDAPVTSFRLHAKGLELGDLRFSAGGRDYPARMSSEPQDVVSIEFSEPIPPGEGVLSLYFQGALNKQPEGLYLSDYLVAGERRRMATTQFEAALAREAFPLVDEPAAKATFDISLHVPGYATALSNTRPRQVTRSNDGMKTVEFQTTMPLAPYAVYLGAGELDRVSTSSNGIELSVYATPGKADKAHFALEAAKAFLAGHEGYFGIPFSAHQNRDKIDLIAVPDFGYGAMENDGAIVFRENLLLCDPNKASLTDKLGVVVVTAHELAHMWFGNLVTMKWWNDLWLNESFADWFSYDRAAKHYAGLDPWASFLATRSQKAFELDSLGTSHPIQMPIATVADMKQAFSPITYSKGASLIRMLEAYVGPEAFRRGIQTYLRAHLFGNTEAGDLWAALESSGKEVRGMMEGWVSRTGHPVIDADLAEGTLRLRQRRFLSLGSEESPPWTIPLRIEHDGAVTETVMEGTELSVPLGSPGYVKVNAGEKAFVRVNYSPRLRPGLAAAVAEKRLGRDDRWGVHRDMAALVLSGDVGLRDYLGLVQAYRDEDDILVLNNLFGSLDALSLVSKGKPYHAAFADALAELYASALQRMGWDPEPGEPETKMAIRARAILGLGRLGQKDVLERAQELCADIPAAHPDLHATLYSLRAWQDGASYDDLVSRYVAEQNPQVKLKLLAYGLTGFREPALLQRTLEYGLGTEVRKQDLSQLVAGVTANPQGVGLVAPWLIENWESRLQPLFTGFESHVPAVLTSLSLSADRELGARAEQAFSRAALPGAARQIRNALEHLEVYARFLERADSS